MLFNLVALSVILSFICTEFTGILTGGLVSSGYLAYFFDEPARLIATIIVALLINFIVRLLQRVMILYGRRRFATSLLLSLIFVYLLDRSAFFYSSFDLDIRVIGFIIPGLIASDMEKQGAIKTLAALASITLSVRLLMIIGG